MEGQERMGRGKASPAGLAHLPASIEEDPAAACRAGQEVSAREIHTNHLVGNGRIGDPDMGDVMKGQGRACLSIDLRFPGVST